MLARAWWRAPATAAAKKGASSSFFAMPIAPAIAHAPTAEDAATDDLDKYLALPVEDNLDLDVFSWWKARDHDKAADPASGRPAGLLDLAKMAAQYLGRPASSAGVERMFSKAGKLVATRRPEAKAGGRHPGALPICRRQHYR